MSMSRGSFLALGRIIKGKQHMSQILLIYNVIGSWIGFSTLLGFIFACIKSLCKNHRNGEKSGEYFHVYNFILGTDLFCSNL